MVRRRIDSIGASIVDTLRSVADDLHRLGSGPAAVRQADRLLVGAARRLAHLAGDGGRTTPASGRSRRRRTITRG